MLGKTCPKVPCCSQVLLFQSNNLCFGVNLSTAFFRISLLPNLPLSVSNQPPAFFIFHSLWLSHSLCPYKERQAGLMSSNEECLKNLGRKREGERKRGEERECLACNKPGRGKGERERTCLEGWCHSFAQIGGGYNSNTGTWCVCV